MIFRICYLRLIVHLHLGHLPPLPPRRLVLVLIIVDQAAPGFVRVRICFHKLDLFLKLLPHPALVPAVLPVPLPHAGLGRLALALAQRLVFLLVQQVRVEPG